MPHNKNQLIDSFLHAPQVHFMCPMAHFIKKSILCFNKGCFFWWARRDLNPHVRSEH